MQGYAPGQDAAFAQSRECYQDLEDWMASEDAAGLQHGELEEQLDARGRELLRRLFQDRLDLTAAREERRHDVAGEDGVIRTRAEKGRTRPLVTKFGQVTVSRIAYRSPGRANVHLLDRELNLPEEKHSHGLRKLAAIEAARGSMEAAATAITRATGVTIGKRQAEELARRCAAHVEAFYLSRVVSPAPRRLAADPALRREGHRDAARCAAPGDREGRGIREEQAPEAGSRPGRRTAASEWPSSPPSTTPPRSTRTAGRCLPSPPAQKRRNAEGAGSEAEGREKAAGTAGHRPVADRLPHR